MEDNKELILVYKEMPIVNRDDRFSVVITPQHYLLKKEHLAIKQEYQSRKIAASLFDELIDSNKDEYSFFVYKEDEDWIFIAYNQNEIVKFLEEVGISSSNVNEIFFAQQFASSIKHPIKLGNDNALVSINGIATVVSTDMLPEDIQYTDKLDNIKPKKGVLLSQGHMFDSKIASILSAIFIIFGLLFLLEGKNLSLNRPQNQEKINTILEKYPALSSSYTRESILSKYQKINKIERRKRDIIAKLAKIMDSTVKVDEFKLSKNSYSAVLSVENSNQISSLINRAKQNGINANKISSNQLKIEGLI
jgi:hypothetical protein